MYRVEVMNEKALQQFNGSRLCQVSFIRLHFPKDELVLMKLLAVNWTEVQSENT